MLSPVKNWLTEDQLKNIYSADYWNDLEAEKKKDWWIVDGNYKKCLAYLKRSGLFEEYNDAEILVKSLPYQNMRIADLAAGIGWTSSLLSKIDSVAEVHSVEISQHRLTELYEHSIRMLNGNENKLHRYIGSFYDLKFEDSSFDVIFFSQAFHHADRPLHLLVECDRILKPGGIIILIGEHYFTFFKKINGFLRNIIKTGRLETDFHKIFPTDHDLGDHYYPVSDYRFMFSSMGYEMTVKKAKTGKAMYFATKQ